MCAWYQVVASCAVNQKTVPKAKKIVVASRTARPTGNRPIAHQQMATSMAARTVKMTWSLVARPQSATNGSRATAGSGGNGSRPRATPSRRRDRQHVLEERVAGQAAAATTGKRIAAWPSRKAAACHTKWS